jgi:hypothetical protein
MAVSRQSRAKAGPDLPPRSRVDPSVPLLHLSSTCGLVLFIMTRLAAAAPAADADAIVTDRIQVVVDRLRDRLGIPESVHVSIQPRVALIVSVEAPMDHDAPFRLAIEDRFLLRLSEEELDAAMAHELGHVWVFTHHPYLQTEKLANQIAMRVVTRDSLVSVYQKLWEHGGSKGDLNTFLGP